MGSYSKPLFDLNEPPVNEKNENEEVAYILNQRLCHTSTSNIPGSFLPSEGTQRLANDNGFAHAPSSSRFQHFVRSKDVQTSTNSNVQKVEEMNSSCVPSCSDTKCVDGGEPIVLDASVASDAWAFEREEGEWSDAEENIYTMGFNGSNKQDVIGKAENVQCLGGAKTDRHLEGNSSDPDLHESIKNDNSVEKVLSGQDSLGLGSKGSFCNSDDVLADVLEGTSSNVKIKEVKGIEANHALRVANNFGKRPKLDEHKEAMLGKKRSRQTVFINIDDVKPADGMRTPTPRRQSPFPSPVVMHTMKEVILANPPVIEQTTQCPAQPVFKEQRQANGLSGEGSVPLDNSDQKVETNGGIDIGLQVRSKKTSNSNEVPDEGYPPAIPRQGSWKRPVDQRQPWNFQVSSKKSTIVSRNAIDIKLGNKRNSPAWKQTTNSTSYQDTSIERLLREVTNQKFWHHPEESELQCVPRSFQSAEEYVRVFEPLLFEECRAQLYSTWEESTETVSRGVHIMIRNMQPVRGHFTWYLGGPEVACLSLRLDGIDVKELGGWYDIIVLPAHDCKWTFKEGDVAILSSPRPSAVRLRRQCAGSSEDDVEIGVTGRVVGTVRRHSPIGTREPTGAILHVYVGDTYDYTRKVDEDHVLRKFQPRSIWYLTVLGSLATTQREYVALHAFRHLNLQMQTAILKPSPEHFPKYKEQPPAMPECFTHKFFDHLHRNFNGPQLAAIQWAAMHTAAGSGGGMTKKQDPWPFTLVQGPPGTGKTHTVWGMLNVIHLVQYQHYYTALLKKLAPESYKQSSESTIVSAATGSIDEVLQNMDQFLFRALPKLCPKPRMLVCAPSNAATDELLARVLDRGFIDGEMKVYRPDVARVGVDSQTRAAQAVSVERRTEQLLDKKCEEVIGWMHQLRLSEAQWSQKIALLQRELNAVAASGRFQGSVGVDPDTLSARDWNRDFLLQNLAAAVESRDKVLVEISRLLIVEGKFRAGSNFNLEEARSNLEASFANEAEIVFTTISSSGRKLFSHLTHGFDMVVIDEAAQASEVAILPPLSLGAARCVLVGDPQQLPATVISKAAGTLLYSRSLFERFQQAGCPAMLLSVQYRMHPQIRDFPSRYFYQGCLTDSESIASLADEVYYKDHLLKPYVFFDISHGRESHRGASVSYQNVHEAQFCLRLYEHLHDFLKSNGGNKISVGIITPYKLQLRCIRQEFEEVLNSEEGKGLYINTVDAFQGQERDVIIMSCVRASNHGVGFVADIRRMNVALTRARRALWVVGNANALIQSDDWAMLIKDAKSRKCFMDVDDIPYELLVPKVSTYASGKVAFNLRGLTPSTQKQRQLDNKCGGQSQTNSQDDEKFKAPLPKNGSYRNLRITAENSWECVGRQSTEKYQGAYQHNVGRRQNTTGIGRGKESMSQIGRRSGSVFLKSLAPAWIKLLKPLKGGRVSYELLLKSALI
ncbi:hypothetical protein Taro_035545, partial [Colocasia esculenta]|nr:hypothetical protein [Colocasia esculenta]